MIAVTDHNSCGNAAAIADVAGDRLLVVPGMEVETSEEVHVVCYFATLEQAYEMEKAVKQSMKSIKNRSEIFGRQLYLDSEDRIIGEEENLLVCASGLDIYETVRLTRELGGAAVPAHIDRTSYSVLSNLGFLPSDLEVSALEITKANRQSMMKEYPAFNVLTNSDAHYLENISEREYYVELNCKTAQSFIDFLCKYD